MVSDNFWRKIVVKGGSVGLNVPKNLSRVAQRTYPHTVDGIAAPTRAP